jgi:hypothetical protein
MSSKVGTRECKGQKYDIRVNEDGEFFVLVGDVRLTDWTMQDVIDKAEKQLQQKGKKSNIRAIRQAGHFEEGKGIVRGSFTGIHAGTGNFIFKTDKGGIEQVYESSSQFLSEEFADEYESLCKAAAVASRARNKFLKEHQLNFSALVKKALA